mmetsp:Transcript_25735/g.81248  ORF Transcript_25735/g.81248 Transcript_25735/m.81248 type:complete len:302 (+) Transcript_25735:596-1501(+)
MTTADRKPWQPLKADFRTSSVVAKLRFFTKRQPSGGPSASSASSSAFAGFSPSAAASAPAPAAAGGAFCSEATASPSADVARAMTAAWSTRKRGSRSIDLSPATSRLSRRTHTVSLGESGAALVRMKVGCPSRRCRTMVPTQPLSSLALAPFRPSTATRPPSRRDRSSTVQSEKLGQHSPMPKRRVSSRTTTVQWASATFVTMAWRRRNSGGAPAPRATMSPRCGRPAAGASGSDGGCFHSLTSDAHTDAKLGSRERPGRASPAGRLTAVGVPAPSTSKLRLQRRRLASTLLLRMGADAGL